MTMGYRVLRGAALVALVALGLILWAFFDGRPIVLVMAMSVGQGLGTLSLVLFLGVVLVELRRSRVLRDGSGQRPGEGDSDAAEP